MKAAVELFAKKGFRGTTTRELASAVGVTEPVLYQHFATKKDLYTAIVDRMVADVSKRFEGTFAELESTTSDERFFTVLGHQIVAWYMQENRHIRLLLYSALEGHDLAELWHERATTQFIRFVEQHIAKQAEQNHFRVQHPITSARAFIGAVAHYCLTKTVFLSPCDELPTEQVIQQFVDVFLNGVRAHQPQENESK